MTVFVVVIKLSSKEKISQPFLSKIAGRFGWENRVRVRSYRPNATDNLQSKFS